MKGFLSTFTGFQRFFFTKFVWALSNRVLPSFIDSKWVLLGIKWALKGGYRVLPGFLWFCQALMKWFRFYWAIKDFYQL